MKRLFRVSMICCVLALAGCSDDGPTEADLTLDPDSDGDGWPDSEELAFDSDPEDPDSTPDDVDGNGIPDDEEDGTGSDDVDADPDDDGSTSDVGDDDVTDDSGSSDDVAASCDASTWEGCGSIEVEQRCTNHGDNGPILTTDYGGFSDVILSIVIAAELDDDDAIQVVYLDGDAERVSLPVSGRTFKENEGTVYLVVPTQEASKAHTFSHVLVNGNRVSAVVTPDEFTSGPFTEEGRCTTEEIEAAKAQVEADGSI